MRVLTEKPFCIVYSLYQHPMLGTMLDVFANQVDDKDQLMLIHQSVSSANAKEFSARMDAADFQIVKLIEQMRPEQLVKSIDPTWKKQPLDFLLKIYDASKPDKILPLCPAKDFL
jgi:hypothetical protein